MQPKRQIINIRGPNAVGKTTLMRQIIGDSPVIEVGTFDGTLVKGHFTKLSELELPVLVVGPYDGSKYSGCDKIKSAEAICAAVTFGASTHYGAHVFFEGFRVSKSWERFATLRNTLVREAGVGWLWTILHPPSEQFIFDRADARREEGSRPTDRKELGAVCRQMGNTLTKVKAAFPGDLLKLDPTRSPEALRDQLLATVALREAGHG